MGGDYFSKRPKISTLDLHGVGYSDAGISLRLVYV
jgi:hypothetical protein